MLYKAWLRQHCSLSSAKGTVAAAECDQKWDQ